MVIHEIVGAVKPNALLCAAAFFFIGLFAVFFPSFYVSIDEHEYLKNASLLVQGKITDANPLDYCGGKMATENYHSTHYLGKSFFLAPFLPFGLTGAMLSGLFIHLLNAVILFFVFRRLNIDTRFVIFYLFFPAFVWNSRTLNSELLVLTTALAGTFFFLGKKKLDGFLSGIFFGLASLVRYDQALLFAGFALVRFLEDRNRFFWLLAGFSVVALLILGINTAFYGGPLNTPTGGDAIHYLTGQNPYAYSYWNGRIVLPSVVANLLVWIAIFLVAYPLMLLSPLFILFLGPKKIVGKNRSFFSRLRSLLQSDLKKTVLAISISAVPLFYLFSQYTGQASYPFFSPLTITGRMRYLIPLAGLLLIPYAISIQIILQKIRLNPKIFFAALFLVLGFGTFLVSMEHQQKLVIPRQIVLNQILENTPDNALIIGSSDDCLYFNPLFSGNRQYFKVNSQFFSLNPLLYGSDRPIFFMDLEYANKSDSSNRQEIIDQERKAMRDALSDYNSQLVQIFSARQPHFLSIYVFESGDGQ